MAKKRTIAQIRAAARPRTVPVTLYLAGDLVARIDSLERELAQHSAWTPDSMAAVDPRRVIAQEILDLQNQVRDQGVEFVFQPLLDSEWSALLLAHPPRHAEEAWNSDTLLPELVARCCVDPVMTLEEYADLAEVLNQGQRDQLESAAWRANNEVAVPFSLAASAIAASRTDGT